ncbi:1483_t:CDS:2 [Ambispora gerdemannii]|uniref:Postreplication repair E3 ubiquitin-protein ligase RAD18 n=1 Tax=Ambispora gerdemannii TaxID=144530 RepID=A0A9N9H1V4_9GLOM|nr:1483_t:CDS:2 [Ambispora gerdemannii]
MSTATSTKKNKNINDSTSSTITLPNNINNDFLNTITDPTDFTKTNLRNLDSLSRCPICKDFYETPVLVDCGHSFCSLCIRRSIVALEAICPICHVEIKESQFRKNDVVEGTVKFWKMMRPLMLKHDQNVPDTS